MPETATAPAPITTEAPKIDPAAPPIDPKAPVTPPAVDNPFEFELEVKGQKQKMNFKDKAQLTAVIQKALYADQVIKDGAQATKGAKALMDKLRTEDGLREILSDPAIGLDIKKFAVNTVKQMMEEENLTPEQKESREDKRVRQVLEKEKADRELAEVQRKEEEKRRALAQTARTEIIDAMKKYPDIPQTQATMDACILNMRAAFKRFGKHLTAEQAMTVYSEQYWKSLQNTLEKMTPEQVLARFGQKTLDKLQKLKLDQLRKNTDPKNVKPASDGPAKKKKHLTEKEFDQHFKELAGGL